MSNKYLVFGCGGFGKEVMWILEENIENGEQLEILGYIDDREEMHGQIINEHKVVGNTDWLLNCNVDINVVIGVGNSLVRHKIISRLSQNKYIHFPSVFSNTSRISKYATFGNGCIVCAGTIVSVNAQLEDFVTVNFDCTVGHDAILKRFTTLYPSVNISGSVIIGEETEIGTGSHIIQGRNIGNRVIIGAGTVIIKDIPPNVTTVGNPARIVIK